MSAEPVLSIVIPAYNEERRLPAALEKLRNYLDSRQLEAEVIVVDDSSTDNTPGVAYSFRDQFHSLVLLSTGRQNHGKGYAVKVGMLAARGRVALFTDTDLSSPIEESEKLIAAIENGNDVAIGSRAVDRRLIEARQSLAREWAGIAFNQVVQLMTGLRFVDTQCGFKAFRMPGSKILFEQQRIQGFGFDPEILFLAQRHGLRAVEVPVRWAHDPHTKVRVLRDGLRMLADLGAIRWNALSGAYPRQRPS